MEDERVLPFYESISGLRLANFYPPYALTSGLQYRPKDGDVFLVTYPQCGTLWMQQILYVLLHNGSSPKDAATLFRTFPLLELEGSEAVEEAPRPGIITSHLPHDLIPKSSRAKYIVLVRDPRDVCAGMFRRLQTYPAYEFGDGKLGDFLDLFCADAVDYRGYFSHLRSWYDHKDDPNVFWLSYEELHSNFTESLKRVSSFLGIEPKLFQSRSVFKKCHEKSSVSYMKKKTNKYMEEFFYIPFEKMTEDTRFSEGVKSFHASVQCSGYLDAMSSVRCVRNGKIGAWKDVLTADDAKRVVDRTEQVGRDVAGAVLYSR
ncbi:hypothetical protein HPB48_015855 [Haemaphysalis longicornis]|uniref:Sulfotransferase domain-containing protein n=1 Tax=Haemaphysalis longicornis TaxID=44386 RepID=A0A9J6H3H8_HAELO|nr:hypothetical protein HPB48_015855 [Haemaphysalis longicornis]